MTYTYDLLLRRYWKDTYVLCTKDGRSLFKIRAFDDKTAYDAAVAFMSSWPSVIITLDTEKDHEE